MKILLGSDPEMFVKQDGILISAWGLVEGTKKDPLPVECGAIQVDGMALEYNTDPAITLEEWEKHHVTVQAEMLKVLGKGMTLEAVPTAFFAEEVFNTSPEEALVLGCEPDFNAWTKRVNPAPDGNVPFRTGAGHIHIGWTEDEDIKSEFHLGECRALAKALDIHLGVPSLLMDDDDKRRTLYGKAGCYRPKSYGMEYRTLSNFWIKTQELRAWAYHSTLKAIECAQSEDYWIPNYVQGVINNSNIDDAEDLVREFHLEVINGRV